MAKQRIALKVSDLVGGYPGRDPVLHGLNFQVAAGEVVALVGLNGAGKSTTIKHILGLLEPSRGEIRVQGRTKQEGEQRFRRSMAYIPETPLLYDQLTTREHLTFVAMSYQLNRREADERARFLLERFQMEKVKDWFPEYFSKGMKQKTMIMNALLVQPPLYVIDEPFVGLDPRAIDTFLQLLEQEKKRGAGILMSTHILSMVEHFCDRFILLHEGKILLQGSLSDWRERTGLKEASLNDIFMTVTRGNAREREARTAETMEE